MQQRSDSQTKRVDIAQDFSPVPAGRFYTDGPNSGQRFRNEVLIPSLGRFRVVEIVFDGVEGVGSSFLEEAFGGLVREQGMAADDVLSRLHIVSNADPSLLDEISEYVRDAKRSPR